MSNVSAKLDLLKIGRDAAPSAPPRSSRLMLAAGAVVALGAAGALLVPRSLPERAATPVQAVQAPAPVAAPAAVPAAQVLVASGYVVARRRATVAAEVTGRLMEIRVEEGQRVAQGQVLAVLDAGMADSELASAQARVASADASARAAAADLAEGRDTARRSDTLAQTGFLSKTSLVKDRARVANLEAQLGRAEAEAQAARADAARLQAQRRQYDIRAPFAGIVVDKNAQPGEIVSPISGAGGFTRSGICTIIDMDSLEIQAEVNENYIGRVRPGQQVDAVLDAYPDLAIAARVLAVVPTANRDKGTVRVRIALLQPEPKILPDMAVKVTIHATSSKGN
jgi:RND family efflux transporter MFP subunit